MAKIITQCKDFIQGLRYLPNFINQQEKQIILKTMDQAPWSTQLKRQQQCYGIKYFQTTDLRSQLQPVLSDSHHSLIPFEPIINKMIKQGIFDASNPPNQALANKYTHNIRLGLHVEDEEAFGDTIAAISMGNTDYLRLVSVESPDQQFLLPVENFSCYVLSGEVRHKWKHGIGRSIQNRKYKGLSFLRYSLTIRHVLPTRRKVLTQP